MSEERKLTDAEMLNLLSTIASKQLEGKNLTSEELKQVQEAMDSLKKIIPPRKSIKETLTDFGIKCKEGIITLKDSAQDKIQDIKTKRRIKKKEKLRRLLNE